MAQTSRPNFILSDSQEIRDQLDALDNAPLMVSAEDVEDALGIDYEDVDSNDPDIVFSPNQLSQDNDEDSVSEYASTSASQDVTSPPTNKKSKRKGGRKKDEIWNQFEKVVGETNQYLCNHCHEKLNYPQVDRLKKHLEKCTAAIKKSVNGILQSSVSVPASAVSAPVTQGRFKQATLNEFFGKTPESQKKRLDEKLEKFLCSANLPFRVVENKFFLDLIKELRPSYIPPSAKVVGSTLLDSVYNQEMEKFKIQVNGKSGSILQDGWTTNQHECVIAHSICVNNKTYFISAISMEEKKKSAENCHELLINAIKECEETLNVTIVACVTDNCNTMLRMHRILNETNPDIITFGCNAHLLNLVGKKFNPEDLADRIVKVQKYFRSHDLPAAMLKKLRGTRPVIPGDTRWNSWLDCFRSYVSNQAKYLEISRNPECKMTIELVETLQDVSVFQGLKGAISRLEPIAISLDKAQRENATAADAVECWLNLRRDLGTIASEQYFMDQFIRGTPVTSVAAYMIHPLYKGKRQNLSLELKANGRRYFLEKDGRFVAIVLALESRDETLFSSVLFEEAVISGVDPFSWWRTASSDNPEKIIPEFVNLCEILLKLPASTAGLERTFSTMGNIISDKRNRLGLSKVDKLFFVNQRLRSSV